MSNYMPGDILFYTAFPNDVYDSAISLWTGSPIVHVAVAVSALQKVEALLNGVMITPIDNRHVAYMWSYTDNAPALNNLLNALSWLHQQIGQPYGYGDVAEAVLYKLEHNLTVEVGDHFDCSALALEFLLLADGIKQLVDITDVHIYTPAMLYKLLTS